MMQLQCSPKVIQISKYLFNYLEEIFINCPTIMIQGSLHQQSCIGNGKLVRIGLLFTRDFQGCFFNQGLLVTAAALEKTWLDSWLEKTLKFHFKYSQMKWCEPNPFCQATELWQLEGCRVLHWLTKNTVALPLKLFPTQSYGGRCCNS